MWAKMWLMKTAFPALSWDQAIPSFSWINIFQAGKQAIQYPRQISLRGRRKKGRGGGEKHPIPLPFSLSPYPLPLLTPATQGMANL